MIALITASYWDTDDHEMKKGYVAKSDCDSFREAAEYAEFVYGKEMDEVKIEILDTELYLSEEIFAAIREDKYL